jgi:DNA polymerase-4
MKKVIFHVDVNSAFLSWEAVDRLQKGETTDLRTIPSAVCGDPKKRRGVILARSVPAKQYGVTTGEPVMTALKKCPSLTLVPPNHRLYERCSAELLEFLKDRCPVVEPFSIDECFMDMTGMEELIGEPLKAAYNLKDEIKTTLGFTVNIGISENRLLAKMASDFSKPDKVHTLYPKEIKEKLWPMDAGFYVYYITSKCQNQQKRFPRRCCSTFIHVI